VPSADTAHLTQGQAIREINNSQIKYSKYEKSSLEAAGVVVGVLQGANVPRRKRRETAVIIVRTGTKEFANLLESFVSPDISNSVYRLEQLRLIKAFRDRFTNEKLTLGFLMPQGNRLESEISNLAKISRGVGVDTAAIVGRGADLEVFRRTGIDVRPVNNFARPLLDYDGWLPVAVVEEEGVFDDMFLPVWAHEVALIEDPLMRDHVRFLQVYTAAVLAALGKDKKFGKNYSLLRAELLRILGRSGYENVVTSIGDGLNINPVAYQLMMQISAESELSIAA
jgi:hypothetical protein